MRTTLVLFVALLAVSFVSGADIALTDGRVLKDAVVVSQSIGRVCIRHSGGLTQVDKTKLPEALAAQYAASPEAVATEDARREELARAALVKEEKRSERWQQQARVSRPAPQPLEASTSAIKDVAEAYARRHFRDIDQRGSNASITVRVSVTTEEPEPISGWFNQWRVRGHAAYTDYNSTGWGSYSKNAREFEVVVLATPGEIPKVKDFTAR